MKSMREPVGWNGSSAGMGGYGIETGRRRVWMGVIDVPYAGL